MSRLINYTNMKFNHLTLLRPARTGGQGVGAIWYARCDCGTEKEVVARNVSYGRVKSCGNCSYSRGLRTNSAVRTREIRAVERRLYERYVSRAARKGLHWELTADNLLELVRKDCRYCGAPPSLRMKGDTRVYNLLDRVRTDAPYTLVNCSTICPSCRDLKGQLNREEFLDYVYRIVGYTSSQ